MTNFKSSNCYKREDTTPIRIYTTHASISIEAIMLPMATTGAMVHTVLVSYGVSRGRSAGEF